MCTLPNASVAMDAPMPVFEAGSATSRSHAVLGVHTALHVSPSHPNGQTSSVNGYTHAPPLHSVAAYVRITVPPHPDGGAGGQSAGTTQAGPASRGPASLGPASRPLSGRSTRASTPASAVIDASPLGSISLQPHTTKRSNDLCIDAACQRGRP